MSLRVGIVGLGRIGGGVLRNNFAQAPGGKYDICVVCDVMPIDHVAYLIAHDSTYGRPPFTVDYEGSDLILGGKRVHYQRVDRRRSPPEQDSFAPLRQFDLDVLFDATGTASINDFRALIQQKIARKILCTWNVAGCDLSVVFGVNHQDYNPQLHDVLSASTCTGNAMVPMCDMLSKQFGIDYARIITIHPALSDQKVLDGYHPASQLGRACAVSIVPTPTNVGKSTACVLPELEGKLDSLSYRVPTAIVSVIDFTATLSRDTSLDEVTDLFNSYAKGSLAGIIHCEYGAWGHQKASIDYQGTAYSAIILMEHLTLSNRRQLGVALMHDNEHGYCCRVLDVLGMLETHTG
ncbi:MAG: glyceraldehyde-3-phosphate dehydrogenase [Methylomonas sp.]|nr:MAG: glyceraldehyde-3-phosphate dehydrogenase [Methylomonas sp.]